MKRILSILILLLTLTNAQSQQKNFIDQPYIEVKGSADTLVTPDRIYIKILIAEEDTKGKSSVEELEQKMILEFKKLNIDIEKQLFVADASSDFKSYFFSGQKVLKSKRYKLLVYDASTLGNVLRRMQEIGLANIGLGKTEHSQLEDFKTLMKAKAVVKAKENASRMAEKIEQGLGKAIYISETNAYAYALRGQAETYQMKTISSANQENIEPDLSFDQIEIRSEVLVRFILN